MPHVCVVLGMNNVRPTVMFEVCQTLSQQLQTNAGLGPLFHPQLLYFMSFTIHIHDYPTI